MTADDPTPSRDEGDAAADPGHGRRALAAIGARALTAWIREVIRPRDRLVALAVGALVGTGMAQLISPVIDRADGAGSAFPGSIFIGVLVGGAAGVVPVSIRLTRAIRRHPSITGTHPAWRDAALLDTAVDARGRVTLAPGTAERVATEARRAIASAATPVPGAVVIGVIALGGIPLYALESDLGTLGWFIPFYLVLFSSTLWTQSRVAGRMALLRDAADAELALPESERTRAPHVEPPHGSMLP